MAKNLKMKSSRRRSLKHTDDGDTPAPSKKPTQKPTKKPTKNDDDEENDDEENEPTHKPTKKPTKDNDDDDDEKPTPAEDDDDSPFSHAPTPTTYTDDLTHAPSLPIQPDSPVYSPSAIHTPTPYPSVSKPTTKDDDDKEDNDDAPSPSYTFPPTPTELAPSTKTFPPTPKDYSPEPTFAPSLTRTFAPTPSDFTYSPTTSNGPPQLPTVTLDSFSPTIYTTCSPSTAKPSASPSSYSPVGILAGDTIAWYQTTAFIVAMTLLGLVLLIGGFLNFWWNTSPSSSSPSDDHGRSGRKDVERISPLDTADMEAAHAEPTESSGLLSGRFQSSSSSSITSSKPSFPSIGQPAVKSTLSFRESDLYPGAENQAALMQKFTQILSTGIMCQLHTTKGPKPVILSMVGNEVRWQAATKTAIKRYKLNLRDVIEVEVGKLTSNFLKGRIADDELCFSLVTQKTTLDLEANSKLERDSLIQGFKITLDSLRNK